MAKYRGSWLAAAGAAGILAVLAGIWIMKNAGREPEHEATAAVLSLHTETQVKGRLPGVKDRVDQEQKLMNDFAGAGIEYIFGEEKETVDRKLIKSWLSLDSGKAVLDKEKVREYVEELAAKYDTVGKERIFVNSYGKAVTVSGGPYGWVIDCERETEELYRLISNKAVQKNRSPVYKQTAMLRGDNDIGTTYVEINLTAQKMWFYKAGELIMETDVVTGNTKKGHDTPAVVGFIHNRVRNVNLVGRDYVSFVNFWMKVYGSIGIHDASWRSKFGGSIYKTNGSHGCVNTPYKNVKVIFDNIEVGTPVVIFEEKTE